MTWRKRSSTLNESKLWGGDYRGGELKRLRLSEAKPSTGK